MTAPGGYDIVFECARPVTLMERIVKRIKLGWPDHVLVHVEGENETLIYKDPAARGSWEKLGAAPENANTMVHMLWSDKQVTMVVDDPEHPEMKQLLDDVRVIIRANLPLGTVRT